MKLLLFTDTIFDANGVSRFIQNLAASSLEVGYDFTVISSTPLSETTDLKNIINLKPFFKLKMPYYPDLYLVLPSLKNIKKIINEMQPDIIHISTPGPVGWSALRYAKKQKIKVTGTYHTDFPKYIYENTGRKTAQQLTIFFMQKFYQNMATVFSRSKEYLSVLEDDIKIDKEKTLYLEHGIDIDLFHKKHKNMEIWKEYSGIDENSIKVLYVGRLTTEKNFPFLLELFEEFAAQRSKEEQNVELIVVGSGEILSKKENLKSKKVHLLGLKTGIELSQIYASSDIFIFPSITDTLGQVVLEAQASALPVMVSNVGGPQTIVKNSSEKSGFIIPVEDKQVWITTINKLCDNEELRKNMGEAGYLMMQENSFEKSFQKFWQTHKELM